MTVRPRFLVAGDAGLDVYLSVHHWPAADEKVFATRATRAAGGVGVNTAVAAAALGVSTGLVARLGNDVFGQEVMNDLNSRGIDLSTLEVDPRIGTYFSVSTIDESGEKALIVVPGPSLFPDGSAIQRISLEGVQRVHTVAYDPAAAGVFAERARQHQIPLSVDLEPATLEGGLDRLEAVLTSAEAVFVNRRAADVLGGDSEVVRRLAGFGVVATVFTRGEDGGAICIDRVTIPFSPPAVKIVDSTGAGDCFAAAYSAARLRGAAPVESAKFACVAATLSCAGFGATAAVPSFDAVLDCQRSMSQVPV